MLARDAQSLWEDAVGRIGRGGPFSVWLGLELKRALALSPDQAAHESALLAAILRGRLAEATSGDPMADVPLPAHDPLATREAWEQSLGSPTPRCTLPAASTWRERLAASAARAESAAPRNAREMAPQRPLPEPPRSMPAAGWLAARLRGAQPLRSPRLRSASG